MDPTTRRIELAIDRMILMHRLGVGSAEVIGLLARDVATIATDEDPDRDLLIVAHAIVEDVIDRCEDEANLVPMLRAATDRILCVGGRAEA